MGLPSLAHRPLFLGFAILVSIWVWQRETNTPQVWEMEKGAEPATFTVFHLY